MAMTAKLKNLLKEWDEVKQAMAPLQKELAPLQERERAIRKQLVEQYDEKVEGSKNVIELANGYQLKMTYKLKREIDEPSLKAIADEMVKAEIPVTMLIKNKPQLETKIYRALTDEQRSIVDKALTIKEESPTLEIVPPKA